jgi:hypothetical protein
MAVAMALLTTLVVASSASAVEHHPTGVYKPFADCPLSNSAVEACAVAETTSGEFKVGKKTVPINKTITLQGGLKQVAEGEDELFAAEDGNTLSKTQLEVPGGILGVTPPESWPLLLKILYHKLLEEGLTGVTETAELAQGASAVKVFPLNLVFRKETALKLPVRVKLENPLLGNECYIGSAAKPVALTLTTGTTSPPLPNKAIEGASGTLEILEGGNLLTVTGSSLVDNAFSAPEVTGCSPLSLPLLSAVVDPFVDELVGLGAQSAAGHNTAILNGNFEEATAEAVKASE